MSIEEIFDVRPERPGYRLHRLEVFNWGTFDSSEGQIYSIQPEGRTSLLVGQNGSGKSTLVDAILTLLVPSAIRNYNVAAGAKKTERNERSYIRGACESASDANGVAVTQFLRPDGRHYAALLAVFHDEQLDKRFALLQVLYLTSDAQVEKIFAFSEGDHRLADDLDGIVAADQVRSVLNERGYRTTKKYKEFQGWFARRTSVRGKAMDMFNQTVAVKDIQSLNRFIRDHMLEAHDWRDKVQRLLGHFSELSAAHRELVRVRRQQELLEPVEKVGRLYQQSAGELHDMERVQLALDAYFRTQTVRLFEPELERWTALMRETQQTKTRLGDRLLQTNEKIRRLKNEIENAGGQRLREIPLIIAAERLQVDAKSAARARFHDALATCKISRPVHSAAAFAEVREALTDVAEKADQQRRQMEDNREALIADRGQLANMLREEREELELVSQRRSNLPGHLATLRARLCEDLGIRESEVPFAAELMAVRTEDHAWQASVEMVLRPFALSLLVPERLYRRVSTYVERTRLTNHRGEGQRLVYLCVRSPVEQVTDGDRLHPQSLVRKLQFRTDHELTPWVRHEVTQRYRKYECCDTIEQFHAAQRFAVTINRHLKVGTDRHEKDDRQRASDPRHFVLGWDNREKRRRLTESIARLESERVEMDQQAARLLKQIEVHRTRAGAAHQALQLGDFDSIDADRHLREIEKLEQEKRQQEEANDTIALLRSELAETEELYDHLQHDRDSIVESEGKLKSDLVNGERLLSKARRELEAYERAATLERHQQSFPVLDQRLQTAALSIENLHEVEKSQESEIVGAIARLRRTLEPQTERLLTAMNRFLREFKEEQDDLDARVDSLESFLGLLEQIRTEDLPRHEARFKNRLNEKVSQEVALFHSGLKEEAKQIEDKIRQLNGALGQLEYRDGTMMQLEPRASTDREITDFQRSLRECLDESFEGSPEALEARFLRIEKLVNRLADKEKTRWRDKVIDVRRWYDFAAREVEIESGETRSFYEDSSGQSGGEKAKLAFTILVAAIAYQYDLDPSGRTPGRFHFVVVDEMFSKVDDRYAEYALRLFEQFGLQLLIVAPLDAKARVTEPFVDCYLHVVKDERTSRSQIYSMTAREYEQVVQGFASVAEPVAEFARPQKVR